MLKQWEPSADDDTGEYAHYDDHDRDNPAEHTTTSTTDRKGHQSDGRQLVLTSSHCATRTN
jgi:hypothetical protein